MKFVFVEDSNELFVIFGEWYFVPLERMTKAKLFDWTVRLGDTERIGCRDLMRFCRCVCSIKGIGRKNTKARFETVPDRDALWVFLKEMKDLRDVELAECPSIMIGRSSSENTG